MNTKSKRQLNRSQHATRAPRHYSKIINDEIFVHIGWWIVGIIIAFLICVVLLALV